MILCISVFLANPCQVGWVADQSRELGRERGGRGTLLSQSKCEARALRSVCSTGGCTDASEAREALQRVQPEISKISQALRDRTVQVLTDKPSVCSDRAAILYSFCMFLLPPYLGHDQESRLGMGVSTRKKRMCWDLNAVWWVCHAFQQLVLGQGEHV